MGRAQEELEGFSFTEEVISDEQLKMMFACCHPSLTVESQIILTLRILCGLGTSEVARALLKKDEAIALHIDERIEDIHVEFHVIR